MGASYASGNRRSRLMARWVSAYERYALRKVKHVFLSLPSDLALAATSRATLLPPGFDHSHTARRVVRSHSGPARLGFVGLLAHRPNRRGLMWFAREVLPDLRESEYKDMVLWVAGTGLPAEEEVELRGTEGVELKGYVRDLAGFYASVDLAIAPLLDGQGAPTKVVEALGHGVPVVGTRSGLRGLAPELRPYCFEVVGNSWREAIAAALDAREAAAASGRDERHTWAAVFERCVVPVLESSIKR